MLLRGGERGSGVKGGGRREAGQKDRQTGGREGRSPRWGHGDSGQGWRGGRGARLRDLEREELGDGVEEGEEESDECTAQATHPRVGGAMSWQGFLQPSHLQACLGKHH